jgi:hypothetical protein
MVLPAKVFWDSKLLGDMSTTATVALHTRKEQPHSDEGRPQEGVSGGDLDGAEGIDQLDAAACCKMQ